MGNNRISMLRSTRATVGEKEIARAIYKSRTRLGKDAVAEHFAFYSKSPEGLGEANPMATRCLYAWTALDPTYPEYLNISVVDGALKITVRGPAKDIAKGSAPWPMPGETVCMTLPREQWRELARDLQDREAAEVARDAQDAKPDTRSCTCPPDERPEPCERKYASRDCWRSAVRKETQEHIVALKNSDRSPSEQRLLDYLMRVREALSE